MYPAWGVCQGQRRKPQVSYPLGLAEGHETNNELEVPCNQERGTRGGFLGKQHYPDPEARRRSKNQAGEIWQSAFQVEGLAGAKVLGQEGT